MVLNPAQRSFSQFCCRLLHRLQELYLIELLSREPLSKSPGRQVQRLHAPATALFAKQTCFPRRMKRRLRTERRPTRGASIELRKPPAKPHRPKRKVTQGQLPRPRAFHFSNRKQEKPEHRLRHFVVRQHLLRDFTDHRQPGAQLIIALRLMKRFEQLTLLDAHQVASLFLDIPELDMRKNLERRAITILDPPRARSHTAHSSRRPPEETHQAVGLSQRKGLQNDCFRFPGRHEQSARRRLPGHFAELLAEPHPIRAHTQD